MEREAKYRATERIKPKQIEELDFTPYVLGERQTVELRDTILDTDQQTLTSGKYSLRVRHDGTQLLLTLKSPGEVSGAVHSRPELEAPITATARDTRADWPPEIAAAVAALIGDAALQPLIQIRNRRRSWQITRDGEHVGELALDRGKITADDRSLAFHEIEIELKGTGNDSDLTTIQERLATLPLVAETRSKTERGVQLYDHNEHRDSIKAAAKRSPMTPTAVLAEAGRSLLAKNMVKLHDAWPVARTGSDPEGVHQMRVATRRLRANLAALGETVYDPELVRKLRRGLRELATDLGAVRDTDVFLATLDKYAAKLDPLVAEQLGPLQQMLIERRAAARTALLTALQRKKTANLAKALDEFVVTEGAGVRESDLEDGEVERTLVRHWAGGLLWSHYERVRAYEIGIGTAAYETLHQLRIEIKHLRYTLELFQDALDDEAASLLGQLVVAQDHLGDLQDAVVAIDLVDHVLVDHPDNGLLHAYRAEQVSNRDRLASTAPNIATTILGLPFRRRLGSLISKL